MNHPEMKHRVRLCLALYLLFAFIPGLHGALHPAAMPVGAATTASLPEVAAACPDGCENPEHRHLTGDHDCPVCKTGWNSSALPQPQNRGLLVDHGGAGLAQVSGFSLRTPYIRTENARAPPEHPLL